MTLDFNIYQAPEPQDLTGMYSLLAGAQGQAAGAKANLLTPATRAVEAGNEHQRRLSEIRQEGMQRAAIAQSKRDYDAAISRVEESSAHKARSRLSGIMNEEKITAAKAHFPAEDQAGLVRFYAARRAAAPGTEEYKAVETGVKALNQPRSLLWADRVKFDALVDQIAMEEAGVDDPAQIPDDVRAAVLKGIGQVAPDLEIDSRDEAFESFLAKTAKEHADIFGTAIGGRQVTEQFAPAGEAAAAATAPQSTTIPSTGFLERGGVLLDELLPGGQGAMFAAGIDAAARAGVPFKVDVKEGEDGPYLDIVGPRGRPDDAATRTLEGLLNTPGPTRDEFLGLLKTQPGTRTTATERRELGQKPKGAPTPAPVQKPKGPQPAPTGDPYDAFNNFGKYLRGKSGGG